MIIISIKSLLNAQLSNLWLFAFHVFLLFQFFFLSFFNSLWWKSNQPRYSGQVPKNSSIAVGTMTTYLITKYSDMFFIH